MKEYPRISLLVIFIVMILHGCTEKSDVISGLLGIEARKESSTIVDIDSNKYSTVKIGDQVWMAENLKTTRYRDGSQIPNVTDAGLWSGLSTGAWVYYNNSVSNDDIYGKLYNWYAVADARGICPEGWHVPTDEEWMVLSDYLGGLSVAGGKMKATGTQYWKSPNTGATNQSGFTALPGSYRYLNGSFDGQRSVAYFWSLSEFSSGGAWFRQLSYGDFDLFRSSFVKTLGFSVRCLKD